MVPTSYYNTPHWLKTRGRKLRANPDCELCGGWACLVHHLHYRSLWRERDDDLLSLCRGDHTWADILRRRPLSPSQRRASLRCRSPSRSRRAVAGWLGDTAAASCTTASELRTTWLCAAIPLPLAPTLDGRCAGRAGPDLQVWTDGLDLVGRPAHAEALAVPVGT
jgi:hypothetical protein